MSEVGHTPGPWHHSRPSGAIRTESKKLVASVFGDDEKCIEDERQIANARLIAAAPDMLAALNTLLNSSNDYGTWNAARNQANEAIKKATKDLVMNG